MKWRMTDLAMIRPGEPAPVFKARSDKNPQYAFDTAAGRNLVLTFIQPSSNTLAMVNALSRSPLFDDQHAALFIVLPSESSTNPGELPLRIPGVRAFYDTDGAIAKLYGMPGGAQHPVTFILSPRLQVIRIVTSQGPQHAAEVIACVENMPDAGNLPSVLAHPPILIIPNVFEPELCDALIRGYKEKGGRVSGFMRDVDGQTVEIRDARHKIRRDWSFDGKDEPALIAVIQDRVKRRVAPEIRKAFQFDVTRMERYLVSCYRSDEGGHFRPHRDDTTKGTAHRRFAVSLNLNAEAYEGGDLRFPEFGRGVYRPPTGGCCVFSCSLLHEAMPVLRGERYAFLPFLYDEAARRIRDANLQFITPPREI